MDEVIERRKWLWSRKKGRRETIDADVGAGGRRTVSNAGMRHARVRRRPTLSHFLAECERNRRRHSSLAFGSTGDGVPIDDVNFRLQQRYWGKIHRRTPTPSASASSASSSTASRSPSASGSLSRSSSLSYTSGSRSASTRSASLDGEREERNRRRTFPFQPVAIVVDEEENELLGIRRKHTLTMRSDRPLSTSALPDPPRTPTMPTPQSTLLVPPRKKSSGLVSFWDQLEIGRNGNTFRDSTGNYFDISPIEIH